MSESDLGSWGGVWIAFFWGDSFGHGDGDAGCSLLDFVSLGCFVGSGFGCSGDGLSFLSFISLLPCVLSFDSTWKGRTLDIF